MKKLLVSVFFLSLLGCKNASIKVEEKKQEQFKMAFSPSFIPSLTFNLKMEKDSGEVTYYVARYRNLLTNIPTKTIVYDSVTLKVGGASYLKFAKIIRELDYKNYKGGEKEDEAMIDGLFAYFQYISISADTTKLRFQSCKREEAKVAYELIDGFFEFGNTIFKDNKTRLDYLDKLKQFFDYNLSENQ
jgi:hypothetical protein